MATYRQPRQKNDTMPCWTSRPWPHNLNQTVSGKSGAVQSALGDMSPIKFESIPLKLASKTEFRSPLFPGKSSQPPSVNQNKRYLGITTDSENAEML
ncbi:hypothetical protein GGQ66_004559 [Rhizobium borbori]|uniref:Uncharacterized protein n=1 Tax=Allorhizobium borbori TaxID=485907 RepID=A0A7W6K6A1_9HYPH|nr:hypothetical protein [Allorhizobium borbori]